MLKCELRHDSCSIQRRDNHVISGNGHRWNNRPVSGLRKGPGMHATRKSAGDQAMDHQAMPFTPSIPHVPCATTGAINRHDLPAAGTSDASLAFARHDGIEADQPPTPMEISLRLNGNSLLRTGVAAPGLPE
ncbi:hypothetical protein [Stenotrophomonas chelatiphaga]|nr:hypothetical protein [Stenotrophomonas chelatiphaga]